MIGRYIAPYLGAALTILGFDAIWLTLTNGLYRAYLGSLLLQGFRPAPAVAFYALFVAGLTILVIAPAVERRSVRMAALRGALFGLVCYGTYDLTNQATLVVWHVQLTLMDMAWGTFLSAAGASAGYFASRGIKRMD